MKKLSSVPFDLKRLFYLAKDNDIIEFEIKSGERVVKLGASSDCKPGNSKFFDKRYYIGNDEYLTAEEFEKELLGFSSGGKIDVITIDGVKAEKW